MRVMHACHACMCVCAGYTSMCVHVCECVPVLASVTVHMYVWLCVYTHLSVCSPSIVHYALPPSVSICQTLSLRDNVYLIYWR